MDTRLSALAERSRSALPEAARVLTEVTLDNPGQVALIAAGSIVLGKLAVNAVRPRTLLEALATMIVADACGVLLLRKLTENGTLRIRIRDADGRLVPLKLSGDA